MERVAVTARLNRITLQFEEAAFARLEAYLADAAGRLEGNPDRAEILADLEEAVADQCRRRMREGQSVVTLGELAPALDEIGTVQAPGAAESPGSAPLGVRNPPRPLQQVSEGALISGVCQGLAEYFRIDVTLLRVIAVVLLIVSGGTMVLVYAVLMLLLPYAPPRRGAGPVRKIPAKCREFVELLRGKLSAAAS
jgi:phage shock protein PspC (stress-responsive transcriptional regulator)